MLEINLRNAFTVTITTTPQQILAARVSPDNRSYLTLTNKSASTTVMVAPDIEYNAASFSLNTGGKAIEPGEEYREQPGGVPSNAIWAWTLSGTAALEIWEG